MEVMKLSGRKWNLQRSSRYRCWGASLLFAGALPVFAGQTRQAHQARSESLQVAASGFDRGEGAANERPKLERLGERYRVQPGDVLELAFPFTPEFNQAVTVQPDGYIILRGAGELHAKGRTVAELAEALRKAYTKILNEPLVTVDLKDFVRPYFLVGGEVGRPGKFELRGDTTVTEAVTIAGGFRDSAKHSQVLLFRRVSDSLAEVKVLNVKKMLQSGDLEEDLHLRSGDMLFVPKNALSKVRPFVPIPGVGVSLNPNVY
jgi:polysaccharide export outer membrane protein